MGWFSKLFGRRSRGEHAVIVSFRNQGDPGGVASLGERVREALESAGAGEYDGHDVAGDGSDGALFLYGPDADRLLAAARPVLEACEHISDVTARLRYGEAGRNAPESVLVIG